MLNKDGEEVDVLLTIIADKNRDGQVTDRISVSRDITESTQSQAAQYASEARYLLLLESARDGVAYFALDGTFTGVNREVERMLGWSREELIGQHYDMIATPASRARWGERIRLTLAGESIPNLFETEAVHKDGHIVPMEVRTSLIRDSQGTIIGFLTLARDITERKRTEERLRETARLSSIGELAAGVAHEINNPLTIVLGYSELLMSADLPQAVRDDLQVIHSEADRAAKIVHNLLSFARRAEPTKTYMDVNSVLERALEMKSYDFRVGNILVSRDLAADLPATMLDEQQLIQVFLNILNNAEQAMRQLRGEGRLMVRSTSLGNRVKVSISDDGPGILRENIGRVFEPFFTTKAVGEGTGLGLSISYSIVRQHEGKIWVESTPGEGATFHIELPVIDREPSASLPPDPPVYIASKANRALVVGDEPKIRNLLSNSLRLDGFGVDTADSEADALRMV